MSSSTPNTILAIAFLMVMFVIAVYDTWAINYRTPEWTVTYVLRDWSTQFPVLPLAIGIVLGHIFFARNK